MEHFEPYVTFVSDGVGLKHICKNCKWFGCEERNPTVSEPYICKYYEDVESYPDDNCIGLKTGELECDFDNNRLYEKCIDSDAIYILKNSYPISWIDSDDIYMPSNNICTTKDLELDDQEAKADNGKPKVVLCPLDIITAIARVREFGCQKYPKGGPDNWKRVDPERLRNALFRHVIRYIKDPNGVDEESGMPHSWHIACNIAMLIELEDHDGLKL